LHLSTSSTQDELLIIVTATKISYVAEVWSVVGAC